MNANLGEDNSQHYFFFVMNWNHIELHIRKEDYRIKSSQHFSNLFISKSISPMRFNYKIASFSKDSTESNNSCFAKFIIAKARFTQITILKNRNEIENKLLIYNLTVYLCLMLR